MELINSSTIEVLGTLTLISGVVFFFFTIFTLYIVIIKDERKSDKAIWILIILLFPIAGSIIYWMVYNRDKRKKKFNPFERS